MASIQGIYIALFGRPADPLGLDYFNGITNGGRDLSQIDSLAGQPEYLSRFEGQNNAQIVTSIYQELFGRNPDAAGLAFFTAQLNSGAQNVNTIAINILDGARGADADFVEAKIAAADQFTDAVRADNDALANYQGADGIAFGQAFLDQIDSSDDVLTDEQVQAQVGAFGDGENVPGLPTPVDPAKTFTLTTGDDFADQAGSVRNDGNIPSNFRFTVGNETVTATGASLGANDTLSDSSTADNDILNLTLSGAVAPGAANITNIETINVDFSSYTGATVDLTNVSGAKILDLDGSLSAPVVFTDIATSGITTVDGSGLTSITNGFTADFSGATGTIARTITGSVAGDTLTGGNGNDVINGGDGADTINGGAGNDTLTGGAGVDTINGGSGNDTINGGDGNDAALNGGAGDDTIDGGAGDDAINGGDGNDTLVGGAGVDTILTGAGNNTVTGGAGNDVITLGGTLDTVVFEATVSANGNDSITGFEPGAAGAGGDVLDFSAFLGEAASSFGVVTANVATAGNEINAADNNVVIFSSTSTIDSLADLNTALAADDVSFGKGHTVVLLETGANANVEVYYADTNAFGETTVSIVGTLNAVDADAFVNSNFA